MKKRNLSATLVVAAVVGLNAASAWCQSEVEGNSVSVPVPLLMKKLIEVDQGPVFSAGKEPGTRNILAVYDPRNELRVAVSREGGGGEVFKTELSALAPPRLLVTDLYGDGTAEVLVCSDKLRVFHFTGDGLSLDWTSDEDYGASPPPNLSVSDFDQDGRLDIAVLNYLPDRGSAGKSLYVYLRDKTARRFTLSGTTTFTDQFNYHSTGGMAIADFTGEGQSEIVVGNDNGWMWLVAIPNGKPQIEQTWKVVSGGAIGPGLSAGNLTRESAKELLVGTNGGDIFVYRLSATKEPEVVAQAKAGRLAYGVQAADIDGDGLDEFLLARGEMGYAGMTQKDVVTEIWKLNRGQLIAVWRKEAVGFKRPQLTLLDLDQDGISEFIVHSPWFENSRKIEAFKPVLKRHGVNGSPADE